VIAIYRKSIKNLEQATKALNLEKNVLNDFISRAIVEQRAIDATKSEKENLLQHIRTQSKLHKQAIDEMEKATAELSSTLLTLKTREQKSEQGFLEKKGTLPPPVAGVLVALFQQDVTNSLGITKKTDGIAIGAPNGSKVKAIFPGTVVFAGYLRGYGNTIIVHHGFQYYSITSRVEGIAVGKNQTVETGSLLGETGETATLIEEGTYFEIRHGSTSLDPLQWLAPGGLKQPEIFLDE
jgi:murein hydrolase activator